MPSDVAAQAILGAPVNGRYTLLAFFNMFIQAPLLDPDATVRATIQPLATWWRLACMNTAGGGGVLSQAAHAPTSPLESALLTRWVSRCVTLKWLALAMVDLVCLTPRLRVELTPFGTPWKITCKIACNMNETAP